MSNNTETSRKLTFWQLLQEIKIEIPIIQRDYAQGREKQKIIRDKILDNFVDSITINKLIELDFIYGSKEDNSMQPLDGQQRLTTLFLLHWYIACKEMVINDKKNIFHNFTYETRTSSKEFCAELINKGVDLENLLVTDYFDNDKKLSKENELSKTIINSSWFYLSWKKDPTIKAMMKMLDAIHQKFKNIDFAWSKLTEQNLITFNYIELKNFGLSDDLYIKMNARGKGLTAFENFKATFVKAISVKKWEENILNPIDTFSHKADTKWTDLLWAFRDKDKLVDNSFLRLISTILLIKQDNKEDIQRIFSNLNGITPDDFTQESFNYLKEVFDSYSSVTLPFLQLPFPFWHYLENDKSTFFETIVKHKSTYSQIVLFYAQTEYLVKNKNVEITAFHDWMRVNRNIVTNSTIDSAETLAGAIALVKEMSTGVNDIYNYLATKQINSKFASEQVKEEIIKAKIIIVSEKNKQVIHTTEDLNFCKGKINFALYCSNYTDKPDEFDYDTFYKIKEVIYTHLSEKDISNNFRRGLLTMKNNQFYDYWSNSYLFAVEAPKRCLMEDIEALKKYAYNTNFRDYLKDLVIQLTQKDLLKIIEEYIVPENMPNWKIRLIKEPNLLDYSTKHYIAIADNNSCCWLIPSVKVANNQEGKSRCKEIR